MRFKHFITTPKMAALGLLIGLSLLLVAGGAGHVHAASAVNDACQGVGLSSGSGGCSTGGGPTLSGVLETVINVVSGIVGAIAVIMVIIGGFRYITSNGDANNVSSAKKTIIYALVGLVVVGLAQLIVHFVIQKSAG